ncbi:unnamed protein product [Caenorhabditis nigoni]
MKLSKYPYVVQNEILDNLNYSDLFLLSLVSRKIRKLVKSSQKAKFKNVTSIVYDSCNMDQPLVYIDYKMFAILKFSKYERTENVQFQLNISGKKIDFRLSDHHYCPVALFHQHERESVIESIHNYFLDFFGTSVEYQWRTDNYERSIPRLQNLAVCIQLHSLRRYTDMKNVDKFFSSHPIWKSIDIGGWTNESLSPESESRLYQAESIKITQYDRKLPPVLRNFQGKQAVLDCFLCKASDLIEFVNRWKSGEAYQNLEHLKITTLREEIPRGETLTAIGARLIDASRRPPAHTLSKRFFKYAFKPNTDPIISHSYVVRDSDNHVASVLIQRKTLSFGVWDKTEKEFLRMVE